MNQKGIFKKISFLKTDNGKINYLKKVLDKENLLSKETKNSVYESLGKLYLEKGDTLNKQKDYSAASNYYMKAEDAYGKAGNIDSRRLASMCILSTMNPFHEKPDIKNLKKLANLYEHDGNSVKAMDIQRKIKHLQAKK